MDEPIGHRDPNSITRIGKDSANSRKLPSRKKRSVRRSRVIVAFAALFLLTAAGCAVLLFLAKQIQNDLTASTALVAEMHVELKNGQIEEANSSLSQLQSHTADARLAGTNPVWRAAGLLPGIGANFDAVREVTVSADDIVNRAVTPLVSQFELMDWTRIAPKDGAVNIEPIETLAPKLSVASNTVELSLRRLNDIDTAYLLPQVADPLSLVKDELENASHALTAASGAAEILPTMLGTEGERDYLLLIQNSAETRATGGIPGALALITADDGRLDMQGQEAASAMGRFDPAIVVDPEQALIYSNRMGRFMQSVNLTPDFPTAAQTAARMWEVRNEGTSVDGVVALDPVALAHLLQATGPVELNFDDPAVGELLALSGLPKSLTAENVVQTLLSDVYAAIEEPHLQDAYFAAVAAEIFDALSSGAGDSDALIQALIRSTNEGRLYVWSANTEEQRVISSTNLAGSVTGAGSGGATFGAYFNDGTGAKMDFYVRRTVQLRRSCMEDGYLQYTLTTTLTNTAPPNAEDSLPAYVTGAGIFGVQPGYVQTNIVAYGPDQAQLQTARIDGASVPLGSYRHGDRPVGVLTTNLAPGQTATAEMDFTNVVQRSDPILDVTPTIQPIDEVVLPLEGSGTCS